jgi:hypothetical protein
MFKGLSRDGTDFVMNISASLMKTFQSIPLLGRSISLDTTFKVYHFSIFLQLLILFSLQMFVGTCMPDKIFLADYPIICNCKSNYFGNKRGHQRTSAYIYLIFCGDGSRNSCVLYTVQVSTFTANVIYISAERLKKNNDATIC